MRINTSEPWAWPKLGRYLGVGFALIAVLLIFFDLAQYALAVAAIAVTQFWLAGLDRKQMSRISLEELIVSGAFLILVFGLVVPAMLGWVDSVNAVVDQLVKPSSPAWGAIFIGSMFSYIALHILVVNWPERFRSDWQFLVPMGLLFVLAKTVYIALVSQELVSGFGSMWAMAVSLSEAFSLPTDDWHWTTRINFKRALFVFYPLAELFGNTEKAYEIPNVIMAVGTSALTYFCAKSFYGKVAGRFAFVISAVAVETWLALPITSHDIPGALFTMALVLLLVSAVRSIQLAQSKNALLIAGIAGLLGLITNMQRGTGNLLLLVFAGVLLLALAVVLLRTRPNLFDRGKRRSVALWAIIAVLPLSVSKAIDVGLSELKVTEAGEEVSERRWVMVAAHTESWGSGRYGHWRNRYASREMPEGHASSFAYERFVADTFHNPVDRLGHFARKSERLFSLGIQTGFYIRGAEVKGYGKVESGEEEGWFLYASRLWTAIFLSLFILGLLNVVSRHKHLSLAHVPLLYLAGLALGLILLSEVQPRYMYQIWYIGAVYGGAYLAGRKGRLDVNDEPLVRVGP